MRRLLAYASALLLISCLHSQAQKQWTVADIYGNGNLSERGPGEMTWAPDASRAIYIGDHGDLMQLDAATAKTSKLLDHEKLAPIMNVQLSEKDRDHRARYNEPDYIWTPNSKDLLFDTNGTLWVYHLENGTGVEIGRTGQGSGDDPKFSPNGQFISYLHDHNLYVGRPATPASAVTNTHEPTLLNGEVDWVYLEELDVRSNYFWSPDSKQLAYLQMNEAAVPQYPIVDWIPTHAGIDEQRYPQPGDPNPGVRVGVVSANGGKTNWMKVPMDEGSDYIPRFGWINPHVVWIEVLTRDHKHLNLYFADAHTGDSRLVLAQSDDKFFDAVYDVNFFADGQFLITSWRDGHTHIYYYTYNKENPLDGPAQPVRQLENGDYEVGAIESIEEKTNTVYYTSNEGDPQQSQVWSVKLDGSGKQRISKAEGVHRPSFAEGSSVFLDRYSDRATPSTISLCHGDTLCQRIWHAGPPKGYDLVQPEVLHLQAADGKTMLYASLLLPPGMTSPASVPLINNPYGGPHAQTVRDSWGGASYYFDLLLAQHGFAVLHVDNRGMGGRGRDFEQAAYRNFGPVQLSDQMAAIDQVLEKYPQLDKNRLGWWGWSWGGTFTLNAMSHSDRIRAGVSVAPVTDFRNYDSIYTERYLGLPEQNADAYKAASVQESAKNLKGHLLLVHGTGDDNVHFANSIQYIQKLIDAKIQYDFQPYPRKTHSIAGPVAHTHLFDRILWHFETYLKPAGAAQ
ncbi:S9 family peptidase [Alloacidobacterium sp.]|uniref:S9 family peptidase n=1 Tax=Alloacidobacterium sp. TaxID=2951999 RepID=UPI002D5CF65E|nr:alpha/beta fold hydrolase [Alloacidobacterium sp.]HYK35399.1 alpha/beta fold hydrolase [Alloacidobacterium sp.]